VLLFTIIIVVYTRFGQIPSGLAKGRRSTPGGTFGVKTFFENTTFEWKISGLRDVKTF